MDYCVLVILVGTMVITTGGVTLDNCPPADPNCHPTCIVYTADHCRYCMCNHEARSFGSASSSDKSSDAAWDRGFEGGDWSNKLNTDSSVWSNTDRSGFSSDSSSSAKDETVKYVIVEKQPEQRYSNTALTSGLNSLSPLPNPFPAGLQSPFAGSHMSPALLPGTNAIPDSDAYGSNVIHVPLLAPGIPKYCVRCRILSCPKTCERVDEYGCRSCPCAPSRYQTMPVMKDCSGSEPVERKPDCSATKLCMETCSDGYKLGDVGRDGCRSCTCIRRAPTTTPKPKSNNCFATLSCMLKCKDGYLLGETQANGCPSCKCLAKGQGHATSNNNNNGNNANKSNFDNNSNNFHNNNSNNNNNNNNNDNNKWNSGSSNWNNNNNAQMMNYGNSGSGNSGSGNGCSGTKTNYLTSNNGIGSGKCEPPMCFDGHMSVDQAMKIGSESAGGGGGCNEGGGTNGNGMGNGVGNGRMGGGGMGNGGMGGGGMSNNGMGTGGSGMGGGGMGSGGMGGGGMSNNGMGTGGSGMSGGGMGNHGMGTGGSGMSSGGMGSGGMGGGMGTGSVSASGSGMPSPFSVSMSGSKGGGMSMKGGGGGMLGGGTGGGAAGMSFSPFSSAMSGGGQNKDRSPGTGVISSVSSVAYNTDCLGAECSAKNRMQHKDCADLVHCLVTCEGNYMLGPLDDTGCQTCSCKS